MAALCRLREAELMFQEDRVADADRLLRTVVRKNPTYAGAAVPLLHASPSQVTPCMRSCLMTRDLHVG